MAEPIRPSLTTNLEDRYNAAGSNLAIGAKNAGGASDHVDVGNDLQTQFQPNPQVGVTTFTPKALNYGDSLGVTTVKYKG